MGMDILTPLILHCYQCHHCWKEKYCRRERYFEGDWCLLSDKAEYIFFFLFLEGSAC